MVTLMLFLLVVFHYVLEVIDSNSFLLSAMLIAGVSMFLVFLFAWEVFKKAIPRGE
jgi:hypothetical protein